MQNPIKQFYKLHYVEKYENYIKSKKTFLAIFLIITNLLGGLIFGYSLGTIGGGLSSAMTAFFPSSSGQNATILANQTTTTTSLLVLNNNWFMEPALQFSNNLINLQHFLNFDSENSIDKKFSILSHAKKIQKLENANFLSQPLDSLWINSITADNNNSSSNSTTANSPFDLGTSVLQGLYSASIFIGGLFGCLFSMAAGSTLGRKLSILLCCVISVIGSVGGAASYSWASLIVFRCILGFSSGIATAVCSVYCAELMPYPKYQGVLGAMFNMGISLGTTFGFVFGAIFVRSSEQWRAVHAFDNIFSIPMFLIVLFIIPESPMFIHGGVHQEQHQTDASQDKSIPAATSSSLPSSTSTASILELNKTTVQDLVEPEKKKRKTMSTLAAFQRLFCSKAIRGTVLACFGCFSLEWTGILAATMFIPSLVASAGVSDPLNQQLVSFGIAIWQLVCIFPTIFLIDKLGRKPIIIFGFSLSLAMDLACGFIFQFGEDGSDYKIILSILFICLYLVGFHVGIGSLGYILAHEVFKGENEKVIVIGTSMATVLMWSTTIVLSLFFIPVVSLTNAAVPWFIFSGISFIGLLLYIFLLKETSPSVIARRAAKKSKSKSPKPEPETTFEASSSDLSKYASSAELIPSVGSTVVGMNRLDSTLSTITDVELMDR